MRNEEENRDRSLGSGRTAPSVGKTVDGGKWEGRGQEGEKVRRWEVKGADLRSLRSVSLDERFAC
jgi:hypothetical protein